MASTGVRSAKVVSVHRSTVRLGVSDSPRGQCLEFKV